MSIEQEIFDALDQTFSGRVYPDVAPHTATMPFATYQAVGGVPTTTFCGDTLKTNTRFQINVWAKTRQQSAELMRDCALALTGIPMFGTAAGGPMSTYDEDTRTYGSMQDFSFWR